MSFSAPKNAAKALWSNLKRPKTFLIQNLSRSDYIAPFGIIDIPHFSSYTAIMGKMELKSKLHQALQHVPHSDAIKSVALFGSHVNGLPNDQSDVDVLIDFVPSATIGYFELFDIQSHFETAVGMKIDLVTPSSISKYFREEVLGQAEVIYEK